MHGPVYSMTDEKIFKYLHPMNIKFSSMRKKTVLVSSKTKVYYSTHVRTIRQNGYCSYE